MICKSPTEAWVAYFIGGDGSRNVVAIGRTPQEAMGLYDGATPSGAVSAQPWLRETDDEWTNSNFGRVRKVVIGALVSL